MKPTIEILDPVHCRVPKPLRLEVHKCLSYKDTMYRAAAYGTKSRTVTRSFLDKRSGIFLTGLLPRVKKYLKNKKVKHDVLWKTFPTVPFERYNLDLTLRNYQAQALQKIQVHQRGVILAPTGSGKTVVIMAACSTFRNYRILFLCHTKDLLQQTHDELKIHMPDLRPQIVGGGRSKVLDHDADIVLATVQSFVKIDPMEYMDLFAVVLVDEAHHCNSRKCQFAKVVQHSLADVKIGFTATLPEERQGKLALEGIIGPVLHELTVQEGIKNKVLAMPQITLVPVPRKKEIVANIRWKDIYKKGVVENRTRNAKIVQMVYERVMDEKSVLIMVKEIEHGDILTDLLRRAKVKTTFVQGATEAKLRKEVKNWFISKRIKVVISTAVWREGINIPTLDVVVNACGGKSEIMTIQAIGRGLRVTEDKKKVEVIDFLDPYKYLAEHAIMRLNIYYREQWI